MATQNIDTLFTKPHPHAELMLQYAQDAMETDKPWERWEYAYDGDYFCWETGGDGDNGEHMMYEMDIYFECLDAGEKV